MKFIKSINNPFFAHETFNFMPSHKFLVAIAEVLPSPFTISFSRTIRTLIIVFHNYSPFKALLVGRARLELAPVGLQPTALPVKLPTHNWRRGWDSNPRE